MDENFATIVNVVRWSRSVTVNIQKFVQLQLTPIIVALIVDFVSACLSGSASLNAVELLWEKMIIHTLGAFVVSREPPNDSVMQKPPIGRGESFITGIMWRNISSQVIYQLAFLLAFTIKGEHILGLTGPDAQSVLDTFIFNTFIFCQVFNKISSRDMEKINVFSGIFQNRIFIAVMVIIVFIQVIIVQFLGSFARTSPQNGHLWLYSVFIGAGSLIIAAIVKLIPWLCSGLIGTGNLIVADIVKLVPWLYSVLIGAASLIVAPSVKLLPLKMSPKQSLPSHMMVVSHSPVPPGLEQV